MKHLCNWDILCYESQVEKKVDMAVLGHWVFFADGVIYKYIFNLLVLILFEWDLFRSLSEDVHHKSVEGGCLGYLLSSTDGVRLVQGDFDWF